MSDKRRILIADPSRVARTALVKHLRDDFDVREEGDGESAWQTLVLDASIVAVVSSIDLGRTNGYELLSRLRENRLQRLSDMPFFLLISKDETAPNREAARDRGVSDFIVRGMAGSEIRQRIGRLVNWDISTSIAPNLPDSTYEPPPPFPARTIICRKLCDDMASRTTDDSTPSCILAFGLESEAAITQRFGEVVMREIGERIAHVVREKIGRHDSIGHAGKSAYLILSSGTSLATATAFAQRVCRALGERNVQVGDQRMRIGISAGIASLPADSGRTAAQLIDLALQRLDLARQAPGSQVVTSDPAADDPFVRMRELLRQENTASQLGQAGLEMMPLLRMLEQQFHFGLPLDRMEARFNKQADGE